MKVKIYRCSKNSIAHLVIPVTSSLDVVPEQVKALLGDLDLWKEVDLQTDQHRIGLDPREAIAEIEKSGYFVNLAKATVTTTVSAGWKG